MDTAAADRPQRAYQKAHDSLVGGWNCCQSVLLAMAETLDLSSPDVLKAATGFGGGVGNMGSLCGALAAGVLTLGLLNGRRELAEEQEKERTYLLCAEWHRRFAQAMGGSDCRVILGVDLKDPATRKQYWAAPGNRERCASRTVGTAARLLAELVEESQRT
ncbi:MAG: C-GCAxxG-C-C family protein [Spirochaetia bacterium]|jgi:C_GCAxxG_C_C family probable redox protein